MRLTNFLKDDGIMMSGIRISDDGSAVVFMRGEGPNREGWSPNPSADPNGPEHAVWAARTSGIGGAWRVVDATNPELAPDGGAILFVKGGQIFRAKVTPVKPASEVDRGEKAFITEWGVQSEPKWSPDGRKIAFVSTRTDHSFILVYDVATRSVKYMSPSVDFDTMPMWLPDSKHLMFVRRPGLSFGQQAQQGAGGIGLPNGPAMQTPTTATPGGRGGGRGNQGASAPAVTNNSPGLMRATFKGGYTLAFYKTDVTTGDAQETWHNQPDDAIVANLGNARLAGDLVIFPFGVGGGRGGRGGRGGGGGTGGRAGTVGTPGAAPVAAPASQAPAVDEWDRYYALNVMDPSARPVLLTTTDGLIENQTAVAVSADGKTFYYCWMMCTSRCCTADGCTPSAAWRLSCTSVPLGGARKRRQIVLMDRLLDGDQLRRRFAPASPAAIAVGTRYRCPVLSVACLLG